MNKIEHLLTCLMEECAEVQQAASKALRFGLDDGAPDSITTNADDITGECNDLIAIIEMLEEENIIIKKDHAKAIEQKKMKVRKYMEYARSRGTLDNN